MPVKIPDKAMQQWIPFDLGDDGDCEICIQSPSFEDTLTDQATSALAIFDDSGTSDIWKESIRNKVLTAVVDWRGVEDQKGDPIPYSEEAFGLLVTAHPKVFHELHTKIGRLYSGLTAGQVKNSDSPPTSTTETSAKTK